MDNQFLEKSKIIKLVIISFVIGLALLVTAIMPAEYGIDPIGVGKVMGFNELYEAQNEKAEEAPKPEEKKMEVKDVTIEMVGPALDVPAEANYADPKTQYAEREDAIDVVVPAGRGIEYKIGMKQYGRMKYEWNSNGVTMFLDFHGDVKMKNPTGWYESYAVAYSSNMAGALVAPFEGKHGWYFVNKTDKDVTVKLKLKGQYQIIKQGH